MDRIKTNQRLSVQQETEKRPTGIGEMPSKRQSSQALLDYRRKALPVMIISINL